MTFTFLKEWLGLIALAISFLGTVYAWLTTRSKENSEHLSKLSGTVDNHKERIQKIESELAHLPSKDDVTALRLAISDMGGTIGRLDEGMKGIKNTIGRVENFLMKADKE